MCEGRVRLLESKIQMWLICFLAPKKRWGLVVEESAHFLCSPAGSRATWIQPLTLSEEVKIQSVMLTSAWNSYTHFSLIDVLIKLVTWYVGWEGSMSLPCRVNDVVCASSRGLKTPSPWCWTSCYLVAQWRPSLCDPMDCSMPGFPVLHHLLEFAQTHVHWVSCAIQPSHPLSSPSPPAFNLSQHQSLSQWVGTWHQVTRVLELQHQSFQWIFRVSNEVHVYKQSHVPQTQHSGYRLTQLCPTQGQSLLDHHLSCLPPPSTRHLLCLDLTSTNISTLS